MMRLTTVASAALLGTAAADFLKTCFGVTDSYGPIDGMVENPELMKNAKIEGDKERLGELPSRFTAWARPLSVMVCSDDKYIHGVKFTLH